MYPKIIIRRRASMNEQKILHFLKEHADKSFSVKELSKELNKLFSISTVTISRILKELALRNKVYRSPTSNGHNVYSHATSTSLQKVVFAEENRSEHLVDERMTQLIAQIAFEKGSVAIRHELTIFLEHTTHESNKVDGVVRKR